MAQVQEVDIEALDAARQRGALVIDVREGYDFEAGHVPGAGWLPLGMVAGELTRIPRGGPVMVICASGQPQPGAAEILVRNGFDAASVTGGTAAWAPSGAS